MDDYISRQAAIDALDGIFDNVPMELTTEILRLRRELRGLSPADVAPVVRCKDCKYNATTHKCLNPDSFFLIPKDDDFCSYGKHREE